MPTYELASREVKDLAQSILRKHETHKPLLNAGVTIDLVMAHADLDDDTGEPTNDAITHNGHKALGLTRKIALKDRVLGRADAEIVLDGDWWEDANEKEREGLLDHELHHIQLKLRDGEVHRDDIGRPLLKLRRHDVEISWFHIVAQRNGQFSQERVQAKALMDEFSQLYWPDIAARNVDAGEEGARLIRSLQMVPA